MRIGISLFAAASVLAGTTMIAQQAAAPQAPAPAGAQQPAQGGAAGGGRQGGAGGRQGGGGGRGQLTVELAPVVHAEVNRELAVVGNLVGDQTVSVVPKTAGRLQEITVKLGDRVTRGQRIAKIEDQEILEQVKQAEAAFEVAKATIRQREADLDLAKTNVERSRSSGSTPSRAASTSGSRRTTSSSRLSAISRRRRTPSCVPCSITVRRSLTTSACRKRRRRAGLALP